MWNRTIEGVGVSKEALARLDGTGAGTQTSPALRAAGIGLAGTVFLAICSHVSIPLGFTPVPLNLQPFGVLLLGLLLGPRLAGVTVAAYLVEGAAGLPVFAPAATGGLAHLLGPTGGFLLAYPVAAILVSWLWRRTDRGFGCALAIAALGDLVILLCGSAWLAAETHVGLGTAVTMAVAPFLPGDALKAAAAAGLATGWRRFRRQTS